MAVQGTVNWTPIVITIAAMLFAKNLFGKDEEEAKREKEKEKSTTEIETRLTKANPFNWTSFKVPKKKGLARMITSPADLRFAARKIHSGIGTVWDTESLIYAGMKTARTEFEIAVISMFYDKDYNRDLYQHLKQNLSKEEMGEINKTVVDLPKYIRLKSGKTV